MQKIRNFLNPLIKRKMGTALYNEFLIKYHWAEIIGNELADKCLPIKIEKNVLYILSESSTLNHHLLTIQSKIVDQINDFVGTNFVKSIFFTTGNLKDTSLEQWKEKKEDLVDLRRKINKINLDEQSIETINELTKNVKNEKFREEMTKVLIINKKYRSLLIQEGYKKCSSCELLVDKSVDKCFLCAQLQKDELRKNLKTIFSTLPYISFEECQKYLKCDRIFFNDVKNDMITVLIKKMKMNKYSKKDLLVYVMLTVGEDAVNLSETELDKICEQVKNKP